MKIPFRNFRAPKSVERWKVSQLPIAEEMKKSRKQITMLSAPTGMGKSLICAMVAKYSAPIINYVCSDKALQDQLLADFPEAVVLKGRSNYQCKLFEYLQADSCTAKCEEYKEGKIACPYYDQKEKLLASDFRILNTHYLLFEMNYAGQLKGQELIIIDEADTLDLIFIGFVSLQVTDYQIKRYNLGHPKLTVVESWIEWATNSIEKLKESHDVKHAKHALDEMFVKADKLIKKLELFLTLVEDDWIYNRHDTYSEFKPVWITKELIDKYLLNHSRRFILCSASLPPKAIICDTLQIDPANCDYIEVGSSFKEENRKVFYEPVMDMSYKNRDKYHVMIDAVAELIERPQYQLVKGIIHCGSYWLGDMIMEIDNIRLMTHDRSNKEEMLKLFMESDKPIVFVTPSSVRGLSLKDDLCRFGIMPKMPFPNTKDKAIGARLYGSGLKGKKWYNAETGQVVLQAAGRHVRSFTDYGDFWILDSCFTRVRCVLPEWFSKPIIQDFNYGDDDDDEPVKDDSPWLDDKKDAKAKEIKIATGLMAPDSVEGFQLKLTENKIESMKKDESYFDY